MFNLIFMHSFITIGMLRQIMEDSRIERPNLTIRITHAFAFWKQLITVIEAIYEQADLLRFQRTVDKIFQQTQLPISQFAQQVVREFTEWSRETEVVQQNVFKNFMTAIRGEVYRIPHPEEGEPLRMTVQLS